MRALIDYIQTDGFRAYALENHKAVQYGGRDTYRKIVFISGVGEIKYDRHVYKIDGPFLLFTRPDIPCTWCLEDTSSVVYVCAFKNEFLNTACFDSAQECDKYFLKKPAFILNSDQERFVRSIFSRMIDEQRTNYLFKGELIQNQICILTHMTHRMTDALPAPVSSSCTTPLAAGFLELVGMEFPPAGQVLHFN